MKKYLFLLLMIISAITLTGCFKRDEMEDINVITTIYPIEYITKRLYGTNSSVSSIYPKGIDYNEYTMTNKQIKDFSNKGLFIYNGLDKEREYATTFLDQNKKLKIIDASFGISYDSSPKEVWLNPSNMLMMAQNVRNDLQNYISNPYMIEEIDDSYNSLKVDITQIDTEFNKIAESAKNKQIIIYDESFNFIKKYGFEVINLTEKGEVIDKNLKLAQSLLSNKTLSYIFILDKNEEPTTIKNLVSKYNCELLNLNTITIITDEEINNNDDYLSIMYNNLEEIKKEVYQ